MKKKIKTTTEAIHLKWKIIWLYQIGYRARTKEKRQCVLAVHAVLTGVLTELLT